MGNKYPNSLQSDLKVHQVYRARVEADYRRKVALDNSLRDLRQKQGWHPPPNIRHLRERVTVRVVEPSVDILTETRPRQAVMPFGPHAPMAGLSHADGRPVTVSEFYARYGAQQGITIEGEYTDVSDKTQTESWKVARWMRRVLQALGMFGKVSPWGRILDAIEIGNAISEMFAQYPGAEAYWKPPAGWVETIRCNPLLSGSSLRDVSRAAWVHQCYIGQAVANTYSTTHRHRILWGQSNPAGTLWSVKQSFEWPGTLPNDNGVMVFQPARTPINVPVTPPGVASIDAAYNKGAPGKTPSTIPYPLRAGRPNTMFYQQGYGAKPQTQAGNQVVIIPPKGPAIVVTRPPADRPPPQNTKERKAKLTRAGVIAQKVVGVTTEALDVLDCLHGALPTKYWAKGVKLDTPIVSPFAKGYFGKGEYRAPTPQEKAAAVYKNLDKVDMVKFGKCVLQEQVEDFVIGKTSKKVRENTRLHNADRPFGWLVGPAL